jgi:2-succinyl-6-hydroxy-2,4-cyclohexadiene-1-carboxylate synthase
VQAVLAAAPERFALAGYSMGARIALHVALAAPERVARLVLISGTAGLADAAERAARREADERLAAETETGSIEDFAARWMALPLFAGDPPEARRLWREDILRNAPAGLAAALRGAGTGAMEPLWERLSELAMPATVLAGERDAKFRALAERLVVGLPGAAPAIVVAGAGHGLPRESPQAVRAALTSAAT